LLQPGRAAQALPENLRGLPSETLYPALLAPPSYAKVHDQLRHNCSPQQCSNRSSRPWPSSGSAGSTWTGRNWTLGRG
jgi:hypothetical protein